MTTSEGSVEIVEPSTEFPILYALLTAAAAGLEAGKQKRNHAFHSSWSHPSSGVYHKNDAASENTEEEPDSSTGDDPAFPLLVFRLTCPSSAHQPSYEMGRRHPRTLAPIQRYGYQSTKSDLYTDEESEEVPSSTTEDDQSSGPETSPYKRNRRPKISEKRESSEELEMPHLEPMVTTSTALEESCTSSTDVTRDRSVSMSPPILLPILDIQPPTRPPSSTKRPRSRSELSSRGPRPHKVLPGRPTSKAFTSIRRERSEPKKPRDLKRTGCRRIRAPVPPASSVQNHSSVKSLADLAMESDSDKDLTKEELNFDKKDYLLLPLDIDVVDQDVPTSDHSPFCQNEADGPSSFLPKRSKTSVSRSPILCLEEPGKVRRSSTDKGAFPCGHCNQVFDSIPILVRHAAVAHVCGKNNLRVDFKIETEW